MSSQATGVGREMRKTVASSRITGETKTPSQAASRSFGGRGRGGGGGGTNRSSVTDVHRLGRGASSGGRGSGSVCCSVTRASSSGPRTRSP